MTRKKLGISQIEINKKFASREEAFKYAKSLREFIRYTCKKKAKNNWQAQAMIIVSNIEGSTSYAYYELNGQVGKPRKKRELFNNKEIYTDWHIHILLVSKPSYAFREEIKKYIDKNWIELESLFNKDDFLYAKLKYKKKVYKKNTNINFAEYMINQNVDILFCNYNYTSEKIIPDGYSMKDLYKGYMKSRTAYRYCGKYIKNNNWDEKEKIDNNYYRIKEFYYNITKEQDKKEIDSFMKKVRISKIVENKERRSNKIQNID
ncbi:MAG: hypothetical protein ACM3O4_04495 [Ignavibacteriales bacterium]